MNDPLADPAVPAPSEHRLLHAILRGEAPPWDAAVDAELEQRFLAFCRAEDVMALAHHQLRRSPGWDAWPEALREPLAHAARMQAAVDMLRAGPAAELSARYLHTNRRRLLLTDLRALPTWRARAALLRETLLPPAHYLLAKYGARSRWLLPWWGLRRAAEGVLKGR